MALCGRVVAPGVCSGVAVWVVIWGVIASLPNTSFADVKLPRLIADGLIIQRDAPIRIWGGPMRASRCR